MASELAGGVEQHAFRAKALLDAHDYKAAALESSRALDILPDLAEISILRGHALLSPLLDEAMSMGGGKMTLCRQDFKEAYEAFRLALVINPNSVEANMELKRLGQLLQRLPETKPSADTCPTHGDACSHDETHACSHHPPHPPHPHADAAAADGPVLEELDEGLDVIIVGAGAAGIGCAFMLTNIFGLEPSRVQLLERGEAIGTSFRMWPEETRFISPSFNQQGWTNSFDLNSIAYGTSPAYTLHAQHPSGAQYADYLSELAEAATLSVKTRTDVIKVEPVDGGFEVHVRTTSVDGAQKEEKMRARYVVWAAGEFQYPKESPGALVGTELCLHNSRVRSWAKLPGYDFVLIGGCAMSGRSQTAAHTHDPSHSHTRSHSLIVTRATRRYESGADAAINLAKAGKQATVLASTAGWNVCTADPSTELAPYTTQRLREVTAADFSPRPKLMAPLRVLRVEKAAEGGFNVVATWQAAESLKQTQLRTPISGAEGAPGAEGSELVVHTPQPPVLCTGFQGSIRSSARDLFNLADESDEAKGCLAGAPMLSADDESTKVPGVFLVGPTVRHAELSFCFIYKFRQRFGVVANAICRGLGRDTQAAVEACRKMNIRARAATRANATEQQEVANPQAPRGAICSTVTHEVGAAAANRLRGPGARVHERRWVNGRVGVAMTGWAAASPCKSIRRRAANHH
eukprot:4678784-Prymnesium_polylepis.1